MLWKKRRQLLRSWEVVYLAVLIYLYLNLSLARWNSEIEQMKKDWGLIYLELKDYGILKGGIWAPVKAVEVAWCVMSSSPVPQDLWGLIIGMAVYFLLLFKYLH